MRKQNFHVHDWELFGGKFRFSPDFPIFIEVIIGQEVNSDFESYFFCCSFEMTLRICSDTFLP